MKTACLKYPVFFVLCFVLLFGPGMVICLKGQPGSNELPESWVLKGERDEIRAYTRWVKVEPSRKA